MERSDTTALNGCQAEPNNEAETQLKVEPAKAPVFASERQPVPPTMPEQELETETPISAPSKLGKNKFLPQWKQRWWLMAGLGVAVVIGGSLGLYWWQYASTYESTDNAYVYSNIHPISSRIDATVARVLVDDNQQVQKGQLLVKLDPRDYQVQVQQAQAALEAARRQANSAQAQIRLASQTATANTTQAQGNVGSAVAAISTAQAVVNQAKAGVLATQAAVAQAEANLQKAQADYNRYHSLYQSGAVPQQQLDTARAAYQVALAQRNSAQQQVAQAQAQLAQAQENVNKAQAQLAASKGGLQQAKASGVQTEVNRRQYETALAAISQAEAQLKNLQLQLSYTNITAPTAGRIGNKTAQTGQRVRPGTPLMAIADNNDWVVANFKETQLGKMRQGQSVEIKIDSFPHYTFIGHVDSFSPGSGATFALLPSDNATGNFTKIVQRIPVKIVFDPNSVRGYEERIIPGMSVVVSVKTAD